MTFTFTWFEISVTTAKSLHLFYIRDTSQRVTFHPVYRFCLSSRGGDCMGHTHLGAGIWGLSSNSTCCLKLIAGTHGFTHFPQVKSGPRCQGRAKGESVYWCMYFEIFLSSSPLWRAHLSPLSQFWPWVSISDERFRGEGVTFTQKLSWWSALVSIF